MKNQLSIFLLLILAVTGCGKKLRPDPVIPAIEANYPTAEIMACGKRWHGLGVCSITKGEPYSDLGIGVQVYHEGTLVIDSKDCDINVSLTYNSTQVIPVHMLGKADRNCVLTMTVSPKYPGEGGQDIRVYSFRGHLIIRALNNSDDEWEGYIRKVTESFSSEIKLWIGDTVSEVRMVMDGCGRKQPYDAKHAVVSGWAVFNLKDIIPAGMIPKTCVLEGFARSGVFKDALFNVAIAKYDSKFVPLPEPIVTINGSKLTCEADEAVSIIALNNKIEIDKKATFGNFDPTSTQNILRLLTVGGRSAIGTWSVDNQKWAWQR